MVPAMTDNGPPSATSFTAAAARAAHLVVDREPWIFCDRLAARSGHLRPPLAARGTGAGVRGRPAARAGEAPSWLGVTMYLSEATLAGVLAAVGGLAPGIELVADHLLPAELRDDVGNSYVDALRPVGLSMLLHATVAG
jgi:O-methyltransferase involved in polyketide biosynthesis